MNVGLFRLFVTFFKLGLFTIGGGYVMIPLIEREVVDKNGWIEKSDFVDLLAIAQSSPGVLAVNVSIFIGSKLCAVPLLLRWAMWCRRWL